jgi:hypothetical protein
MRSAAIVKLPMLLLPVLCACSVNTGPTGNEALGITAFQVTESPTELHVVGVNRAGVEIASVRLTLGQVTVSEIDLSGYGRTLTLKVNGKEARHVSVGQESLRLPLFKGKDGAAFNAFLLDPHVAPVLAERGIALTSENRPIERAAVGEAAYGSCIHDWPVSISGCCAYNQSAPATEYEEACSYQTYTLYNRSCNNCTSGCGGQSAACGTTGGSGCAPCWTQPFNSSCQVLDCTDVCPYQTDYQGDSVLCCSSSDCGSFSLFYCGGNGARCESNQCTCSG